MKSIRVLVLVLLAALALTACDGPYDDGISVGPAVYGVTYDASTNEPLPGVHVTVGNRARTSNLGGSYHVDVPAGTHTVTASKSGYKTLSAEVHVNEWMVEKKLYLEKE